MTLAPFSPTYLKLQASYILFLTLHFRSLWKFDPCYESWQELAPMNVPRSELGLALLDGSVYAVGGWEGSHRLDSVER